MEAKIVVKDKVATGDNTVFVCGNTDYTIKFDFDEEWSAESVKTARFIYNDQFQEVVFEGDTCAAPAVTDTIALAIGVYAGNLRTTTPAFFNCATSILCGSETHADPPKDVYDQLIELWNSKSDSDAVRFTENRRNSQYCDSATKSPKNTRSISRIAKAARLLSVRRSRGR